MVYDDLDDGYEEFSQDDIEVWNSGSVYYDDEIVEYQGKYYIALCKTSAQVPGRSKPGIWKEVSYEDVQRDDVGEDMLSLEDSIEEAPVEKKSDSQIHKEKMQGQKTVAQRSVKPENLQKSTEAKSTTAPLDSAATTVNQTAEPVNKPLEKKTVAQQNQEKIERKMTLEPSDQEVVNGVLKEITFKKIKGLNSDENAITSKLLLPQKGENETLLKWESSHPEVISSNGEVKRPRDGHDIAVNLSVNVSKKQASAQRFFTLWVKAEEISYSDEECVDMTFDMLDFDHIKGQNDKVSVITENLELLTHGLYDTEIYWASNNRLLLSETGEIYKHNLSKNTRIRLYAIITKGNVDRVKHFDVVLKLS